MTRKAMIIYVTIQFDLRYLLNWRSRLLGRIVYYRPRLTRRRSMRDWKGMWRSAMNMNKLLIWLYKRFLNCLSKAFFPIAGSPFSHHRQPCAGIISDAFVAGKWLLWRRLFREKRVCAVRPALQKLFNINII